MASLFGDLSFKEILAASQMIGANLQNFEDRELKKKKDAAEEKRAAAQELRSQESHDLRIAADKRTEKLAQMQGLYGQAIAAQKAGREDEALNYLQQIQNLRNDGKDVIGFRNTSNVSDEDKQTFFAKNPQLKTLEGNGIIARTFDRTTDQEEFIGFKDTGSLFDYFRGIVNPQQLMRDEAQMRATADVTNQTAMPEINIDEKGVPTFYIQRFVEDEDGEMFIKRIPLTEQEALQYDPTIVDRATTMVADRNRLREKAGLDVKEVRAKIGKLEAETRKLDAEARGKGATKPPTVAEQDTATTRLLQSFGVKDVESISDNDKVVYDAAQNYLQRAMSKTNNSIGRSVTLSKKVGKQTLQSRDKIEKLIDPDKSTAKIKKEAAAYYNSLVDPEWTLGVDKDTFINAVLDDAEVLQEEARVAREAAADVAVEQRLKQRGAAKRREEQARSTAQRIQGRGALFMPLNDPEREARRRSMYGGVPR